MPTCPLSSIDAFELLSMKESICKVRPLHLAYFTTITYAFIYRVLQSLLHNIRYALVPSMYLQPLLYDISLLFLFYPSPDCWRQVASFHHPKYCT